MALEKLESFTPNDKSLDNIMQALTKQPKSTTFTVTQKIDVTGDKETIRKLDQVEKAMESTKAAADKLTEMPVSVSKRDAKALEQQSKLQAQQAKRLEEAKTRIQKKAKPGGKINDPQLSALRHLLPKDQLEEIIASALPDVKDYMANAAKATTKQKEAYKERQQDLVQAVNAYRALRGISAVTDLEKQFPGISEAMEVATGNTRTSNHTMANMMGTFRTVLEQEGAEGLIKVLRDAYKGMADTGIESILKNANVNWSKVIEEGIEAKYQAKPNAKMRAAQKASSVNESSQPETQPVTSSAVQAEKEQNARSEGEAIGKARAEGEQQGEKEAKKEQTPDTSTHEERVEKAREEGKEEGQAKAEAKAEAETKAADEAAKAAAKVEEEQRKANRERSTEDLKAQIKAEYEAKKKAGLIVTKQKDFMWTDGATWEEKTGYATYQTRTFKEDEKGNVSIDNGPYRMDYSSLTKQLIAADTEVQTLQHDIGILKKEYSSIDISPWEDRLKQVKAEQEAIWEEAQKFGAQSGYVPEFEQFVDARKKNQEEIATKLAMKDSLADAKTAQAVQKELERNAQRLRESNIRDIEGKLSSQIIQLDNKEASIIQDRDAIQEKYKNIDLSSWGKQLDLVREKQRAITNQVDALRQDGTYQASIQKFDDARKANKERIEAEKESKAALSEAQIAEKAQKAGENYLQKDLVAQIKQADTQVKTLEREMEILTKKYEGIDLSAWTKQLEEAKTTQRAILDDAKQYADKPEFKDAYQSFLDQREKNQRSIETEIAKRNTIDAAREAKAVEAARSNLSKKASGIHSMFWKTKDYTDLQSMISGATTSKAIEDAENAYNALVAKINKSRDKIKSSTGTMDDWQNAKGKQERGDQIIQDYVEKFQMLGESAEQAEQRVKPLRDALTEWRKSDLNAEGGIEAFASGIEGFNKAEAQLKHDLSSARNQKSISDKADKLLKTENVNNFNTLETAVKDVTSAYSELRKIEQESINAPLPFKDYDAAITAATEKLEKYKAILSSVLEDYYKTPLKELNGDMFKDADYLRANQKSSFRKNVEKMQSEELSLEESRIISVRKAYEEYVEAFQQYASLMAKNVDGSQTKALEEQRDVVRQLGEAFGALYEQMDQKMGSEKLESAMQDLVDLGPKAEQSAINKVLSSYQNTLFNTKQKAQTLGQIDAIPEIEKLEQELTQLTERTNEGKLSWAEFLDVLSSRNITAQVQDWQMAPKMWAAAQQEMQEEVKKLPEIVQDVWNRVNDLSAEGLTKAGSNIIKGLKEQATQLTQLYGTEAFNPALDKFNQTYQQFIQNRDLGKYNPKNDFGLLMGSGQIKTIDDMKASMDAYAQSAQFGKLASESVDQATGQVIRTYQSANGQVITLKGSLDQLNNGWRMQASSATVAGAAIKNVISSFSGMAKAVTFMFSMHAIMGKLRQEVTQGMNTFKEFDHTLTTISYTMNLSQKQLQDMGQSAIDMAQDLSMSVANAESIFQIYANMNTTAQEIQETAKPTAILSNLSGVDASTAADEVQGILEQFNMLKDGEADVAEASMHVVDVLDNISANVAMDYAK